MWGIKNGDLDIVKDYVESKVSSRQRQSVIATLLSIVYIFVEIP